MNHPSKVLPLNVTRRSAWVLGALFAVWIGSGCATGHPVDRMMPGPPPPGSELTGLGYDDAVKLGATYAQQLGYDSLGADAKRSPLSAWRLRAASPNSDEEAALLVQSNALTREIGRSEKLPRAGPEP